MDKILNQINIAREQVRKEIEVNQNFGLNVTRLIVADNALNEAQQQLIMMMARE